MKHFTFPSPFLFIAGTAVTISLVSIPATAAETHQRQINQGGVSSSTATAGTSGPRGATVSTRSGSGEQAVSEDCRIVEPQTSKNGASSSVTSGAGVSSNTTRSSDSEALSSTVRIPGQNGLSSTTRVPGGSSVTVHSGGSGGSSSSSSVTSSSSSSGSPHSTVVTGTGQGDDCVITIHPGASETHSDQQPKR